MLPTEYDEMVDELWIENEWDTVRCLLGLVGEAGEIAEKAKKTFRGDYSPESFDPALDTAYELGDVLFYLVKLAHINGYCLSQIMSLNALKLRDRKDRGKIKGSGDKR